MYMCDNTTPLLWTYYRLNVSMDVYGIVRGRVNYKLRPFLRPRKSTDQFVEKKAN